MISIKLFDTKPDDYKTAWNELRCRITELNDQARQTVTSLSPSTLSLPVVHKIFNLCPVKDVFWAGIDEKPVPQYLTDNIHRILTITSRSHRTNEAFSRTVIDQILISAIYEENHTYTPQQRAASQPEHPAMLDLHHDPPLHRQMTYQGHARLLSGCTDYTVWYDSPTRDNLATNLIVAAVKETNSTDTCLRGLSAYSSRS